MQRARCVGLLFMVTLVTALCSVAYASTLKTTQISIINSHGQPIPSLFSGWPISDRGMYILAHKNDPPHASCAPDRQRNPQIQLAIWNPKDKPRLVRVQSGGDCSGNYMGFESYFCTYDQNYNECDWNDYVPGEGDDGTGYSQTRNVCQAYSGGPYLCPNYLACGTSSGGGGDDGGGGGGDGSNPDPTKPPGDSDD
jgi:hypothetical protein